jgi:hypothetical protein
MTINQTQTNKIFLSHYNTINIPNSYDLKIISDIKDLDNDIDEIYVKDIIGLYDDIQIIDFIKSIVHKLKPNGIMHIQDIDIEQLCVYLSYKIIAIGDKSILYANNRKNIFHLRFILNILRNMNNISIKQINFINGYEFYIMVQKNAE